MEKMELEHSAGALPGLGNPAALLAALNEIGTRRKLSLDACNGQPKMSQVMPLICGHRAGAHLLPTLERSGSYRNIGWMDFESVCERARQQPRYCGG